MKSRLQNVQSSLLIAVDHLMKLFIVGENLDTTFQVLRFRRPSESIMFTKTCALFKAVNLFMIIRCVPKRETQRQEQLRVITNT